MSSINTMASPSFPTLPIDHQGRGGKRIFDGKPSYTTDQAAGVLTRSGKRWHDINNDGRTDITYQFQTAPGPLFSLYKFGGFSEFGDAQKTAARDAMASWADVANLRFTQGSTVGSAEGNVGFGNFSPKEDGELVIAEATGLPTESTQRFLAQNPRIPRTVLTSDVYFDGHDEANTAPSLTNGRLKSYVHEVGHALGLSHPHDDDGTTTYAEDSLGYSVMSYRDELYTGQDFTKNGSKHYARGPMVDDIAAAQKIYGANTNARKGDTTYGFNSNADREDFRLKHSSDAPVFTIWDSAGVDTMDFSGFHHSQLINMSPGKASSVGGMKGNVFIAKGATIENAVGGTGDDVFISNRAQNAMTGNGGNNTYRFLNAKQSRPGQADRITDFVSGKDKIDVSQMHLKSEKASGTQAAVQGSQTAGRKPKGKKLQRPVELASQFSAKRNEAVLSYDQHAKQARLEIDTNGNGKPNFLLLIDSDKALKPTDIIVSKPLAI
ncbi:M10 family metallopeptidase [Pseudomonas pisciculturae]|uniref:M10 family metallopeptidase n=1 Tax=Pseudomonas pisciculturae TaxID=2730413 RepID=UPI0018924555|nr:M10 family metallopeptidase [Pseudomonas pisciculturae]